jgi:uncharacterized membrane protein YkvI
MLMVIAILAPLGAEVKQKSSLKKGAILGSLGLGIGAASILLIIILYLPEAAKYEIPMTYIAGKFAPWFQVIYTLILLTEIYTTAVSNLFGFVKRLSNNNQSLYNKYLFISCVIALIFARAGFSNIIHYLYPIVGYAGLILLVFLSRGFIKMGE